MLSLERWRAHGILELEHRRLKVIMQLARSANVVLQSGHECSMPRLGEELLSRRHHDSVCVMAVAVGRSESSHAIERQVNAGHLSVRVRRDDAVGGIGPNSQSDGLAAINAPQSSGDCPRSSKRWNTAYGSLFPPDYLNVFSPLTQAKMMIRVLESQGKKSLSLTTWPNRPPLMPRRFIIRPSQTCYMTVSSEGCSRKGVGYCYKSTDADSDDTQRI